MKRMYTEQAVVRVWRNWKNPMNLPTSHWGHAAVVMSGHTVPQQIQNVSFWPVPGVGFLTAHKLVPGDLNDEPWGDKVLEMNALTALRLEVGQQRRPGQSYPADWDKVLAERKKKPITAPRPGQKPCLDDNGNILTENERLTLKNGRHVDAPIWEQSPDSKVFLPGLGAGGYLWGLNLGRMAQWWSKFTQAPMFYRAMSRTQNCAGVALQALIEGGAASIVKPPKIRLYTEPVQLERYSQDLRRRFVELESMTKILDAGIRRDHLAQYKLHYYDLKDGLWTWVPWMVHSGLGKMHFRSALISEIDRNLVTFHRLSWARNYLERFDALLKIFVAVCQHRSINPESKRGDAVAMLGKQVLFILQQRGLYNDFVPRLPPELAP